MEISAKNLQNIIESILFVSGNAVSAKDIAEKLPVSEKEVLDAAKKLQQKYSGDCGLNLLVFNKKLQFSSNPAYSEQVSAVLNPIRERELSRSMLETAAIIAYKQPVTRADLEEIRGNSEYAIQTLMRLNIIEVVGRKDTIGKPVMFGTTDEFLKRFQLSSLDDLPDYDVLMERIRLLRGTDDTYLYGREEYVAPDEEGAEGGMSDLSPGKDGDIELPEKEEIPDFLKDEKIIANIE